MSLSQEQLNHLERRLGEERERVVRALANFGERTIAVERRIEEHTEADASMPVAHEPDPYNQALDALELSRLSRELAEIEAALERLRRTPEQFGHDEHTGEVIPVDVLERTPWLRTVAQDKGAAATDLLAADPDVLRAYRNERYSG